MLIKNIFSYLVGLFVMTVGIAFSIEPLRLEEAGDS